MKHIDVFPPDALTKYKKKKLGEEPHIHPSCHIVDSQIGAYTDLAANTTLIESTFGDYSYTAGDVSIVYTDVGKFSNIASHARINPGNHPTWRVTMHHMTYRRKQYGFGDQDENEFFNWRRSHRCTIGHDTWLGHGAIVMPGVSIGHGAVVGSGAVVTKDVEPFMIVAGVPAKVIRSRFDDATVEKLLAIAWWDWDRQTLEARFDDLLNMDLFLEKYG